MATLSIRPAARSALVNAVMGLATLLGGETGKRLVMASQEYIKRRREIYVKYHREEIIAAEKFRAHVAMAKKSAAVEKVEHAEALNKVEHLFTSL